MDWKSKRVTAILEAALAEDKVANDITTALTIPPNLKASGTIIAKQPCVVSGLGCIPMFLEIFGRMSTTPVGRFEVVSHPEIFDGVKVKKGQTLAVIRHNASALLSCERVILNLMQRMTGIATLTNEFVLAVKRHKNQGLRHPQNHPRPPRPRQIRRKLRWRRQPPPRPAGRHPHQKQPHIPRRRHPRRPRTSPEKPQIQPMDPGRSPHRNRARTGHRRRRRLHPPRQHDAISSKESS